MRSRQAASFAPKVSARGAVGRLARTVMTIAALLTALLVLAPIALLAADPLLTRRDPVAPADIIVVLGGDGPARAAWASFLWHRGLAPRVLVTGDGDCLSIREDMIAAGVEAGVITTECRSRTTWENAALSVPILERRRVRRAILVTNWFHSLRAKQCFEANGPSIRWISMPVERNVSWWSFAKGPDGVATLKEYSKVAWYWVRYLALTRTLAALRVAPSASLGEERS